MPDLSTSGFQKDFESKCALDESSLSTERFNKAKLFTLSSALREELRYQLLYKNYFENKEIAILSTV